MSQACTTSSPANHNPPCPDCGEPLDYEPAGDDRDEMGRGFDYPKSWGCCACGKNWSTEEIDEHKREAARVARHVARTIGKLDQARKTARLARDILTAGEGGAA